MQAPRAGHLLRELLPAEHLLYASECAAIGTFRCRPDQAGFSGGTPCTSWCFVFPRRSVWIQHEGGRRFVADPSVVTFYNRDDVYRRGAVSPDGDHGDWFAIAPGVLLDAVALRDQAIQDRPARPFRFDHGPVRARHYLTQRRLFEAVSRGSVSSLAVDEAVFGLLDDVLSETYSARQAHRPRRRDPSEDLVQAARALLASRLSQRLSLGEIASELGVSPFYLCHAFRRRTRTTLSGYLMQLRLRRSLELVTGDQPLTRVAHDLGFSSHSHFTSRFRSAFGAAPSALRAGARPT